MWWHRSGRDEDFDREIHAHLDLEAERLITEGLPPDRARAAAHRRFGNVTRVKERFYESRRIAWLESIWRDFRVASRTLLRTPAFTITAVVILALGVASTTVVFSVVDAYLLRPVPFTDPERLAEIWVWSDRGGGPAQPADMLPRWREQTQLFEQVEASWSNPLTLDGPDGPETVVGSQVTVGLFPFLGVDVRRGRGFAPDEALAPVAIISHGLWLRQFGGDAAVVGQTIRLNDTIRTVVGVMSAEFRFPVGRVNVWVPFDPARPNPMSPRHVVAPIARLREGVTLRQADEQVSVLAPQLNPQLAAQSRPGLTARLQPLNRYSPASLNAGAWFVTKSRAALFLILGAAGLVLLASCANAANLFLSRAFSRRREIAVRAALGVGRWRLLRSLWAEAMLVILLAACVGLGLAYLGLQGLVSIIPGHFLETSLNPLNLDMRAMAWLGLASLVAGIAAAGLPALRTVTGDIVAPLTERGSRQGRGRVRSRGLLVTLEACLAVVLVVGAGLATRSLLALTQVDVGWSADGIVVIEPQFRGERYRTAAGRQAFMTESARRLAGVPSLGAVALSDGLPSRERSTSYGQLESEDLAIPDAEVTLNRVSSGYFSVLDIPMYGRGFNDASTGTSQAVVSRKLADRLWPGMDPIGRRFRLPNVPLLADWMSVVGVAGNVRTLPSEFPLDPLEIYQPISTDAAETPIRYLAVQTDGRPERVREVRNRVQAVDPALALGVRPMHQLYGDALSEPVFHAALLVGLGVLALVLAIAGIYAVVSYDVSRQTRELGIRLALGATWATAMRRVLASSMRCAGVGVLVGVALAFFMARMMASMLYEIQPTDALTFVVAPTVLVITALVAGYVPARRITRIEPATSLRAE